jgi:hypothetical protein
VKEYFTLLVSKKYDVNTAAGSSEKSIDVTLFSTEMSIVISVIYECSNLRNISTS